VPHYLDLTLPSLEANLALDEALLLEAEAGEAGEVLRVWEWPRPAVVLGSGCSVAEEVEQARCRTDGVPILRRSSGGGTVLLGPGCLLFSLVLDYERHPELTEIRRSYGFILGRLCQSLDGTLPDVSCRGTSDLAAGERKFSGNAQQRKKRFLLHHGTLLYAFDLALVARYLRPPPRQPEYRAGRQHDDFLCNLPTTVNDLKDRLARAWGATTSGAPVPLPLVERLVEDKYATSSWTHRR
jgi:lipoate-protein ligase A